MSKSTLTHYTKTYFILYLYLIPYTLNNTIQYNTFTHKTSHIIFYIHTQTPTKTSSKNNTKLTSIPIKLTITNSFTNTISTNSIQLYQIKHNQQQPLIIQYSKYMGSYYRNSSHFNSQISQNIHEKMGLATGFQTKIQPLCKAIRNKPDKDKDKFAKENTQSNIFVGIEKEPPKRNNLNKCGYEKKKDIIKLQPPAYIRNDGFRTNSKQCIERQKSSRLRKNGSRSNNRLYMKNCEETTQKSRQQDYISLHHNQQLFYTQERYQIYNDQIYQKKEYFYQQPSSHNKMQSYLQSQQQYHKYDRHQYQPHQYSSRPAQKPERTQQYHENPSMKINHRTGSTFKIKTQHRTQQNKITSMRGSRLSSQQLKQLQNWQQDTIPELECEQDFIVSRKSSAKKSRIKKTVQDQPQIKLTPEEQIKLFESTQAELQNQHDGLAIKKIVAREAEYQSLPSFSNYLDIRQKHINWIKRAVLINWMMEFMVDYSGRRQTLNIAVSIVDRYLCSIEHCPLNRLQLIGASALFIATKLQQSARPSLCSFAQSTSGVFTQEQIMEEEMQILNCLNWEINSPTLNTWCLRLTVQWDLYIKSKSDSFINQHSQYLMFKESDQKSYENYRGLVQLLDFALLDIHTLRYKNRAIVASFMYLILGIRTKQFSQSEVITTFPTSSQYLKDEDVTLNKTFNQFLHFSFDILLTELHPTIQYCASYFILPLTFQLPEKAKVEHEIGYQQFCSYQTINKHNIYYLQRRNRDFD